MFGRRVFFATVLVSATALSPVAATAETLLGALAKAYGNNSELNAARAGLRVTDENVAIAKSGQRPIITGTGSYNLAEQNGIEIETGSFGVQIQQNLFDGFQTRNSVRTAEARVRAGGEALRNTEQSVLFNAASAYMDVIRDRQIAVLTERNLEFLIEQVRAARSRFEVGEGTRTDVAQAEASRSSAEAQLAAARAQADVSAATYRQIIGDSPGKLRAGSPARGLPKSLDSAYSIATVQHPAILATSHLVDAAAYSVKVAEGALFPQLNATAGLSRSFVDENTRFGRQDEYTNSATIGAQITVPIYQGGRVSAQVRQSKESLGQARIQVDVTRDQVRAAVTSAWTQFVAANESVTANRALVSAAQLALNGVIEERNVGQRTTLDVLNAQADVISAQINLASSERDVVVASYAILSATGQLSVPKLGLNVEQYRPEEHYNAVKDKWFGLRTPDGR
ncbi:TolC family outer membrane protein [Arvimicrobium flavum]|uniref:TolC family outer membrane protein n=1 Tax=Arvimicrobium flavum TaxID=3393320 RepID=UPI00237ADA33|nr:TolC family outer membrane protein [Mesorhizobium shangrilense]